MTTRSSTGRRVLQAIAPMPIYAAVVAALMVVVQMLIVLLGWA